MGRALIIEHVGAGLYKATPQWDFTRINLELLTLLDQREKYWPLLSQALDQKRLLEDDVAIARAALDAVVEQWNQALIDKLKTTQPAPPPVPNDPQTGQPWVDPDRAQDQPLLDAINAARVAAAVGTVAMNATLSRAALAYAQYQGDSGRTGHLDSAGRGPGFRAGVLGYGYTAIGELLAYGQATVTAAVAGWLRDTTERATLTGADFTECGVAYCHVSGHFCGHLWVVMLASPGPLIGTVTEQKPDPATKKATEAEAELERVTIPKLDKLSPDQLGKASQNYGIAIAKLREAEREIARLQAENLAREQRITVLEAIKAAAVPLDVWCVKYNTALVVGAVVDSFEVPGFWTTAGTPRTSVLDAGKVTERTVQWVERSWNLSASGAFDEATGHLTPADGLTDAAVFVNLALEPGHLKWEPRWRYAWITAINGTLAEIELAEETARAASNEAGLSIQRAYHYTAVPINYPPCGPAVFGVGDEVVIWFSGANRDQPAIIGFRRNPRTCSSWSRISWEQIQ